jgi:proteic killer suppression protein
MAIRSFRNQVTKDVFEGLNTKASRKVLPAALHAVATAKLAYLHAIVRLQSLAAIPGLKFERLRGDRAGQCSIRLNDQFRICFEWRGEDAHEVEVVDYH